jgi:hypothetical protein
MDWLETVFLGSAVIGGTLFLLRMLTLVIGGLDFGDHDIPADFDGGLDGGLDADLGGDFHGDVGFDGEVDHPSADFSFKFLSLQGLTAFFMMFGIVGLALLRANLWPLISISGGTVAGLFTVWVIGMIFTLMRQLQSEGTLQIKNAIGQQGSVYLTIPANASGQVQVAVQGSLKIFDAISDDKKKIATGEKIKVVNVIDNKTLVVTKL